MTATCAAFLTFVAALDRARGAAQLWYAAVNLHEVCPVRFAPEHVAGLDLDSVGKALRLARVSRRHRPDSKAWHQIVRSLLSEIDPPVTRVIDAGCRDACELPQDLKSRDAHGKSRLPMLRGPNIIPMWIRVVAHPGRARITQVESIPVAVDTPVRRGHRKLGCCRYAQITTFEGHSPDPADLEVCGGGDGLQWTRRNRRHACGP